MKIENWKLKINKRLATILAVILVLSGLVVSLVSMFSNPPLVKAAWYNASWNYRQKIIIDHNKIPNTDQTDFPVLIKITDTNNAIFTKAQADGDDLLFTSSNETTKLSHEIERFSTSSNDKELIAWVKIPTLSHTTDTTIYLYYGNSGATSQQSATDVWSNGYISTYHLKDATTSTVNDSLGVNNGTKTAVNQPIETSGKIGKAQQFDDSYDYIRKTGFSGGTSVYTISAWVNPTNVSNINPNIVASDANNPMLRGIESTISIYAGGRQDTSLSYTTGSWQYITWTHNASNEIIYKNTTSAGYPSTGGVADWTNTNIGAWNSVGSSWNGLIDEVQISSTARSSDWIATEYANQNSPETFFHISGEVGKDNYTYQASPAGWYDAGWSKRQPISLNPTHDKVPNTNQTDFPTLVKLTDVSNNLWASAQADGDDILFADTAGNKLAHEIEKYDNATHELWAWVKIPTLTTGATTTIYMYYGNANSPNQQSKTAVWSNGYAGVWHLSDAGPTYAYDSTANAKTGTQVGGVVFGSSGKIKSATNYSTSYLNYGDNFGSYPVVSESVWVNIDGTQTGGGVPMGKDYSYRFVVNETGGVRFVVATTNNSWYSAGTLADSTTSLVPGTWYLITGIYTGSSVNIYVNGVLEGTGSQAISGNLANNTSKNFELGAAHSASIYLDGSTDEGHVSSTARSADWIATEYANQNDPAGFETFGAAETADTFAPNNPSSVIGYQSPGGALITNNSGSDSTPYYSWPEPEAAGGATDQTGAYISGVAGYYSYFGTSCGGGGADPAASRGVLADTGSGLHYSSDINVSVPDLTTNQGAYCLRLKTKDNAGNLSATSEVATYNFDTTAPNAPTFVAANPAGYSSVNSFDFTWPAVTDATGSGLAGYQYERGGTSGDSWSATQVATSKTGIASYQSGENIFLVRSIDNAGNTSAQVQTTYYYSNDVPVKPTGVTATPGVSDTNSFAFSWTAPVHSRPIVDYGYVINAVPTTGNLTWTGNASTSLSTSPFATAQGVNTFYIVAKDDSGAYGVDVANYGTATFNCTTVAPPIPTGVSITDSSNRTINLWALTIKWSAGAGQGATFDHYSIERSTDPSASSGPTAYAEIATTASAAYIDTTGLNNTTTYYYRVKAVDNADSPSAASSTVSKMPTGKYTTPPTIVTEPSVSIKATQTTISWVVSRPSTSAVRFGKVESDLSRSQIDPTTQTGQSISLVGLEPATKYYYQVQALDADRDYTSESAYSVVYNFTTLAAPSIANVSVSNITLNTADITWETTSASNTKVYFGPTISYGTVLPESDDSMTTRHNIKLSNLTHTTKYHYKIYGSDVDGNILSSDDYTFETLPMPIISQISYQPDFTGPSPQVTIFWLTNVPTTSSVEYSPKDAADTLSFEESQSAMVTNHKVTLSNMQNSTDYRFKLSGRDQFGNLVESDLQVLNTGADMRPPTISDVFAETSNIGSGNKDLAQAVISWKTDEPATSEVEYDTGINGTTYRKKTSTDSGLSLDHLVVISDLSPQTPYHFHVISKDESDNQSQSPDQTVITGATSGSIFNLIMRVLNSLFGWLQPH